jgi:predicted small secreted protein
MLRKLVLAATLVGVAFSASACRTVKGAGQDIQSVGEAGSDAIGNK